MFTRGGRRYGGNVVVCANTFLKEDIAIGTCLTCRRLYVKSRQRCLEFNLITHLVVYMNGTCRPIQCRLSQIQLIA